MMSSAPAIGLLLPLAPLPPVVPVRVISMSYAQAAATPAPDYRPDPPSWQVAIAQAKLLSARASNVDLHNKVFFEDDKDKVGTKAWLYHHIWDDDPVVVELNNMTHQLEKEIEKLGPGVRAHIVAQLIAAVNMVDKAKACYDRTHICYWRRNFQWHDGSR
jgi:hypothetical protein